MTAVSTTAEFGALPRYYITTLRDQAVGPALQKAMYSAQPVEQVDTLDTDHGSYFSQTDELAAALLAIRDRPG